MGGLYHVCWHNARRPRADQTLDKRGFKLGMGLQCKGAVAIDQKGVFAKAILSNHPGVSWNLGHLILMPSIQSKWRAFEGLFGMAYVPTASKFGDRSA